MVSCGHLWAVHVFLFLHAVAFEVLTVHTRLMKITVQSNKSTCLHAYYLHKYVHSFVSLYVCMVYTFAKIKYMCICIYLHAHSTGFAFRWGLNEFSIALNVRYTRETMQASWRLMYNTYIYTYYSYIFIFTNAIFICSYCNFTDTIWIYCIYIYIKFNVDEWSN